MDFRRYGYESDSCTPNSYDLILIDFLKQTYTTSNYNTFSIHKYLPVFYFYINFEYSSYSKIKVMKEIKYNMIYYCRRLVDRYLVMRIEKSAMM
jgi:hypothetical protein